MANFKCDSVEIDIPDSTVGIVKDWIKVRDVKIDSLSTKLASETNKNESYVKNLEKAEAKAEAMQLKLDSVVLELESLKAASPNVDAIRARRKLERLATPLFLKANSSFNVDSFDELSDRNIKEGIVKLTLPNLASVKNDSLSEVSDLKLDAYLEVASENIVDDVKQDSTDPLKSILSSVVKTDSIHEDTLNKVLIEAKNETENAWKKVLSR